MPRSRPAEANLLARNDLPMPAPQAPVPQGDNRTFLQKIADMMPGKLQLASVDPNDGLLSGPSPDLGALGWADSTTAVWRHYRPHRIHARRHQDSRRIQVSAICSMIRRM